MDVQLNRPRNYQNASKALIPSVKKMIDTKKAKGPDSQVYTSICPIVYVIRVFGLAPYEFHNDMLVPSSVNSIFSYACAFAYSYIIYSTLVRFMTLEHQKPLLGYTETGKVIVNYCMAIYNIIVALSSKEKFAKIFNTIQEYDEVVKEFGYARNEKKTCFWSWFILIMSATIWSSVSLFGIKAFNEPLNENLAYLSIYIGTSVSVIKFSGVTMLLGQRFDHLNRIAKKSSPSASRRWLGNPVVETADVERLHNTLMNSCESLNSLYSSSLLLWLGNLNLHVVSDMYFVIQRMINFAWELSQWRILCCLLSWIVAFIGQLMFLSYACHYASSQANNIGFILMDWRRWFYIQDFSRGRYKDVETSMHLMNRQLNFAAGGCFFVNLSLLRSIASLLTTYLVILLQFPE